MISARLLGLAAVDCFIGELEGEAVTTGLGLMEGAAVGIFNVATVPEHRGRGYGTAVTHRCLRAGFEAGARRSYLQSSQQPFGAYGRLGFRTVERWSIWVSVG